MQCKKSRVSYLFLILIFRTPAELAFIQAPGEHSKSTGLPTKTPSSPNSLLRPPPQECPPKAPNNGCNPYALSTQASLGTRFEITPCRRSTGDCRTPGRTAKNWWLMGTPNPNSTQTSNGMEIKAIRLICVLFWSTRADPNSMGFLLSPP